MILPTARKALKRDLCDRCLGRQFAKAGFGLSNKERGLSVRTTLALEIEALGIETNVIEPEVMGSLPIHFRKDVDDRHKEKQDVEEKSVWITTSTPSFSGPDDTDIESLDGCWLCNDIFDRVDELASLVKNAATGLEFSTFVIGCRIDPRTVRREQLLWQDIEPPAPEPMKEELNREIGKRFFDISEGLDVDKKDPDVAFVVDPLYRKVTMQIKPVFIFGRYRKQERGIPQTRWPCGKCHGKGCDGCKGTGRRYETSVEELVGEYPNSVLGGSNYKLHGMGREDVDVLCLGEGRPFILEISRPSKRSIDLFEMQREINIRSGGRIEVDSLRYTSRKEIPDIKDGTTRKMYMAKIMIDGTVDEETLKYNISLLAQSPIKQRTPTRVAHRRSDKIRTREIHAIEIDRIEGKSVIMRLTTDGGLYIKELIHGDEGRTKPSLSSLLGMDVRVESLDVTGVLYEKDGKEN